MGRLIWPAGKYILSYQRYHIHIILYHIAHRLHITKMSIHRRIGLKNIMQRYSGTVPFKS